MLKIRLTRRGKRNRAFFRIVVTESSWPVKGRFLESLGFFNPHTKEKNLKSDRIKYWIEKGAQCSDTVHNLLVKEGIIKGPKRAVKMRAKAADEADKADVAEKAEEKPEEKESAQKTAPIEADGEKSEAKTEKKTEKEAPAEKKTEEK